MLLSCHQPAAEFRQIADSEILQLPKAHRLLVLNFWATWCEPCVAEIPLLAHLRQNDRRVAVVGISMDERSDEAKVRLFVKDHGMKYDVYLRKGGENFEALVNSIDPNWIGGIPATFVYRDGKRIFSKTGQLRAGELERILESTS